MVESPSDLWPRVRITPGGRADNWRASRPKRQFGDGASTDSLAHTGSLDLELDGRCGDLHRFRHLANLKPHIHRGREADRERNRGDLEGTEPG